MQLVELWVQRMSGIVQCGIHLKRRAYSLAFGQATVIVSKSARTFQTLHELYAKIPFRTTAWCALGR